mmetsp:Transcript_23386/g.92936  ORF Transcript_23386/g.92936 Transcript_23386/m.92936 type:complete len:171 (+) Transcript_23386:468-980(+)
MKQNSTRCLTFRRSACPAQIRHHVRLRQAFFRFRQRPFSKGECHSPLGYGEGPVQILLGYETKAVILRYTGSQPVMKETIGVGILRPRMASLEENQQTKIKKTQWSSLSSFAVENTAVSSLHPAWSTDCFRAVFLRFGGGDLEDDHLLANLNNRADRNAAYKPRYPVVLR